MSLVFARADGLPAAPVAGRSSATAVASAVIDTQPACPARG